MVCSEMGGWFVLLHINNNDMVKGKRDLVKSPAGGLKVERGIFNLVQNGRLIELETFMLGLTTLWGFCISLPYFNIKQLYTRSTWLEFELTYPFMMVLYYWNLEQ